MATNVSVVVKNNSVEKALSIFKRKVKESKVLVEYKERQFYTKKSGREFIYDKFYGKMMGVALRYFKDFDTASDVVQESFIKAFSKINQFEGIQVVNYPNFV